MKEYSIGDIDIINNAPGIFLPGVLFTEEKARFALKFHKSLPEYKETKLIKIKSTSHIKSIFVKDESTRFNLKAFKGLGGCYAMFRILCEKLNVDYKSVDYGFFLKESIRKECSKIEFITATDGNHGCGVSWAAKIFGCKAHVFMPKNSSHHRKKLTEKSGSADVLITDKNYDMTVQYASKLSKEKGWILIQDTSFKDYEKCPKWIIEGYLTMAFEISDQLKDEIPTHIFLQAGVGAMAGGMAEYFKNKYKDTNIIIVEPKNVGCVFESIKRDKLYTIKGNPETIMAGLNCGTPCGITYPILKNYADYFCKVDDDIARLGMKSYAKQNIISGESGAVTYGLLLKILENKELTKIFKINNDSTILLINTEGDTNPEEYRKIIQSD